MRRGYFLNFIIMQTEKQKKDFELIKRMGQDFMRKRNKENEERKKESRKTGKKQIPDGGNHLYRHGSVCNILLPVGYFKTSMAMAPIAMV